LGWQGLLAQALRVFAEPKARRFTRQKSPEKMSEYVLLARWLAAFFRHDPPRGLGAAPADGGRQPGVSHHGRRLGHDGKTPPARGPTGHIQTFLLGIFAG
jgi:hypothetical protein